MSRGVNKPQLTLTRSEALSFADHTLMVEQGYSDLPGDKGGPTMWGISSFYHPEYAERIRAKTLTRDEARQFYVNLFNRECQRRGWSSAQMDMPIGRLWMQRVVHGRLREFRTLLAGHLKCNGVELTARIASLSLDEQLNVVRDLEAGYVRILESAARVNGSARERGMRNRALRDLSFAYANIPIMR